MDLTEVEFEDVTVDAGCSRRLSIAGLPPGSRPVWFEVPDELADSFVVTDVRVGLNSQLATAAVPAALFARGAPLDELLMDAVSSPLDDLSITVSNVGPESLSFVCRPMFSDDDARLARYRRARVLGLGVTSVAPGVPTSVIVQPSKKMIPDRIFIPRRVLEKVDVEGVEVHDFDVDGKVFGLLEAVPLHYLSRENLKGDGVFHLGSSRSVGPRECFTVKFRNKTDSPVNVMGAILGGDPLPPGGPT